MLKCVSFTGYLHEFYEFEDRIKDRVKVLIQSFKGQKSKPLTEHDCRLAMKVLAVDGYKNQSCKSSATPTFTTSKAANLAQQARVLEKCSNLIQ